MLGNFKPFLFKSSIEHRHRYTELASFNGRYKKVKCFQ